MLKAHNQRSFIVHARYLNMKLSGEAKAEQSNSSCGIDGAVVAVCGVAETIHCSRRVPKHEVEW
jgi:hypothetical protein